MILCIFMAGCGSQNEVYLETEVSQDTGNVQETEETEAGERLDILDVSGGEQTALDAYDAAVLMPDSKDAKNFWVTLEETILKYF